MIKNKLFTRHQSCICRVVIMYLVHILFVGCLRSINYHVISKRLLALSLAIVMIFTAVVASSTHISDFIKQGQQISGQQEGMQVRHSLPLLHIPQKNVDSIWTSSPLPPQKKVRQELQHLVSLRMSSKYMSSKYRTVILSFTASPQQEIPQQDPFVACIPGLFHSRLFSRT